MKSLWKFVNLKRNTNAKLKILIRSILYLLKKENLDPDKKKIEKTIKEIDGEMYKSYNILYLNEIIEKEIRSYENLDASEYKDTYLNYARVIENKLQGDKRKYVGESFEDMDKNTSTDEHVHKKKRINPMRRSCMISIREV